MNNTDYLIQARELNKKFKIKTGLKAGYINAVYNASFGIKRGKTLGIIGESGSGKTTLGRTLLRLTEPDSGRIIYDSKDITNEKMKPYRKKMQIIFQNPASSLDPTMTARKIIAEAIEIHKLARNKKEKNDKIDYLLEQTGINKSYAERYASEFSKGQQQRITIARALATEPEFIVCDEPTSALDVSIQSQIINLLMKMQQDRGLAYLFISHDIALVKYISDEVAVMYMGCIVEKANSDELHFHPLHPYTIDLLNSYRINEKSYDFTQRNKMPIGEIINKSNKQKGCPYASKCTRALDVCKEVNPALIEVSAGHYLACHLL